MGRTLEIQAPLQARDPGPETGPPPWGAILVSCIVHGVALLLLISFGPTPGTLPQPIIVDFTLPAAPALPAEQERPHPPPPPAPPTAEAPTPKPPPPVKAEQPAPPGEPPLPVERSEKRAPAPEETPVQRSMWQQITTQHASSSPSEWEQVILSRRMRPAAKPSPSPGVPTVSRPDPGAVYLKVEFEGIRTAIQDAIEYPLIARRMGWAGKVVVSFVVEPDGAVSDVKIDESCGHGILDQNALDTVRKCAPFPAPPVRARLVIPVIYNLEG